MATLNMLMNRLPNIVFGNLPPATTELGLGPYAGYESVAVFTHKIDICLGINYLLTQHQAGALSGVHWRCGQ